MSRQEQIEALHRAALQRDERERPAFLVQVCGPDQALRRDVESLLAFESRRIGPYLVISLLGAGGMGEVYRAHDPQLGRDVAIKVLPPAFVADPERLGRFEREARLLATINHPNIATIYGIEQTAAGRALVLELVEGSTLAERLETGPMPIDEVLPIARQIAEALEAAHERGIIHRDLKPANIKITPAGLVKVLDFGLAKATEPADGPWVDLPNSPTITAPAMMTGVGVILGTAAYMSPEQAKGQSADKRCDIWAFGCVLYEMLTGTRAFDGQDMSDTLAAVLTKEPDWAALPAIAPTAIRQLLRRCLEKDRKRRWADMADAQLEIEEALTHPVPGAVAVTQAPAASPAVPPWRRSLPWGTASLLLVGLVLLSIIHFRETPPVPSPEMRAEIVTPTTTDPISFAISPDGRQLVFVASGDGASRLWVRSLAATTARPLAGTEGAEYPFWSPDSRSVGFFTGAQLKRIDLAGGAPQPLARKLLLAQGGTWNAEGVILFAPTSVSPLFRVSASGGDPVAVTKLDQRTSHGFPSFLPDDRHFLFHVQGAPETSGIYLGTLDTGETTRLTTADTGGAYLPSGWLLWVSAGKLVTQRLDLERRALVGSPVTVADPVGSRGSKGAFSVSATGVVAYRTVGANRLQLRWVDRAGKALGLFGTPDEAGLATPRLSPDGQQVAVSRAVEGNRDIWLLNGAHMSPFTFDPAVDRYPLWSSDGSRIVFSSALKGAVNFDVGLARRPGSGTPLLESPLAVDSVATDWSADERFVVYMSHDPQTDWDLWVLPLDGDRKPQPFLKTPSAERSAQFSPDGRWVAYTSNESGRSEIYVRPFAAAAAPTAQGQASGVHAAEQWRVSTAGGIYSRWRRDGTELYYIGPDGRMMAASIRSTGTTLEPGTPVALFDAQIYGGGADIQQGMQYDVTRDSRFLINTVLDDATAPITLLLNWRPELKQ